jgi:peptidoglycan hydrolase-like protein with peptidoglycan-binding domain
VPYPVSDMRKGSSGDQVVKLQKCLNKIIGSDLDADGEFGPATEKAVRSFQKKYKLEIDGIVGPKTRTKIKSMMK